jgi:O-antigen/teichoic acid export membrane protein
MLDGTVFVFLSELLMLPTGIITAGFLTRRLGSSDYGLWTLAVTLVTWIEWGIASVFSRATIKVVGDADDWRPVAAVVLRLHLWVSLAATLALWLCATPIAALFNEATMVSYLRLMALDVPVFSLAFAHRHVLIGIGRFRQRAYAGAGRWTARMLLILLFVTLGFSVTGAILGCIGASLIELVICRFYVRPSLFCHSPFPARQLWDYALPLFLFGLTLRFYDKLDLFALKALGGTAAQAGFYGAAQNLAMLPGIFGASFSPLLLSALTRTLRGGRLAEAKEMGQKSLRVGLWMLPFAGMTAGIAPEIVRLIFGADFLPTAPLLSVLIFGALGLVMLSVATSILIAVGKPGWTLGLTAPLIPIAVAGHLLLIPRFGAVGAAGVSAGVAGLGALVSVAAVYRLWQILPPVATLCRSLLVALVVYVFSAFWHTPHFWLLLKLPAVTLLILSMFFALGEFSNDEIAQMRSIVRWQTVFRRNVSL